MCDNTSRSVFLCSLQIRQQCPGLLQVLRIKPFGEPVVDFGQQLVSFITFALLLLELGEAHRCSQLQRFGLLLASDLDGFGETRFGFTSRI
jgi:hypothetical protein